MTDSIPDWQGLRGLYAIIDPSQCGGRDALRVAEAVLDGGCAVLQLRFKSAAEPELLRLAQALQVRCQQRGVPFVINDHLEIAMACGAAGVHLGQDDLPLSEARARAPQLACGVSTHDPQQARAAERGGASLIGYGPIFATRTKLDPDPVVGPDQLAAVVRQAQIPVVAIGGITTESLAEVLATGVPLVAAIGAVLGAADPARAAREIHEQTLRWHDRFHRERSGR